MFRITAAARICFTHLHFALLERHISEQPVNVSLISRYQKEEELTSWSLGSCCWTRRYTSRYWLRLSSTTSRRVLRPSQIAFILSSIYKIGQRVNTSIQLHQYSLLYARTASSSWFRSPCFRTLQPKQLLKLLE